MNKVVHALVYVILAVACVTLFFEMKLFDKKELLKDRNRMLEDYVVRIAKTIEKADAPKSPSAVEALKDISPVEAKLVETPETENLLDGYLTHLETANLETFNWDNTNDRVQLRQLYFLDPEGNPVPDAANDNAPLTKGKGTMAELLDQLFDRAKAQQAKLNETRAALTELRGKFENLVADYNKIKPEGRQAKVITEETKAKIPPLEQAKTAAEEQVAKIKTQVDDLNAEVTSLKDEVTTAKDETESVKEDLAKQVKETEKYKKFLAQQQQQTASAAVAAAGSVAAANLTAGDKGKLVEVDNKLMFAIVEFTDDAMKELLGADLANPLPMVELGIRRRGFKGSAGEFVGRLKLRQAVQGKNFVVADVLGDWVQVPAQVGDAVFAD